MNLWSHQQKGVEFLVARRVVSGLTKMPGVGILDMGMGTGKTATATVALEEVGARFVLVITPKAVIPHWVREVPVWGPKFSLVEPLEGTMPKRLKVLEHALRVARNGDRVVVVTNHETLQSPKFIDALDVPVGSGVVYDESHKLKSPRGKQSKASALIRVRFDHRIAATGTLTPNNPLDVWAQVRAIQRGVFDDRFFKFRARYAVMGGYQGKQPIGWQNIDHMAEQLAPWVYHVKSEDVLDLPPLTVQPVAYDLSAREMKQYQAFSADLVLRMDAGDVTADNALVKSIRQRQITSGFVPTDAGEIVELGTSKRDMFASILDGFSASEPLVVAACFTRDLDMVRSVCTSAGRGYCELSGAHKEHETWRVAGPECTVLGCEISSGALGVNLTRAKHMIVVSQNWSLGDWEQLLKRIHRPGQTERTYVHHMVARGTVERRMVQAITTKGMTARDLKKRLVEATREGAHETV